MKEDLPEAVENEWYIVRHSGETPEIAYNSAIYQLCRAQDGPHMLLTEEHMQVLKYAAVERFQEIILRDLQHANSTRSIYRGICRSIINYRRFCTFCRRQQLDHTEVRDRTAQILPIFLAMEIEQSQQAERATLINCTFEELRSFAGELGVDLARMHGPLAALCPKCSIME